VNLIRERAGAPDSPAWLAILDDDLESHLARHESPDDKRRPRLSVGALTYSSLVVGPKLRDDAPPHWWLWPIAFFRWYYRLIRFDQAEDEREMRDDPGEYTSKIGW
jgi:hypothetical protein